MVVHGLHYRGAALTLAWDAATLRCRRGSPRRPESRGSASASWTRISVRGQSLAHASGQPGAIFVRRVRLECTRPGAAPLCAAGKPLRPRAQLSGPTGAVKHPWRFA
jgi:hypothetical protein